MPHFSITPREMVASLWRNRYLIKKSIQREEVGHYRGSILRILWSFFSPVFILSVYIFVFSIVFKARWNSGNDSKTEFALMLFARLYGLRSFC
jgi:lipopolysaccharide transport system permease protein